MKTFWCTLLFVVSGSYVIAQSDVATSKWVQTPLMIDGESNEWEQPLNFYDDQTKLFFEIANDSNNIYFCFESKDPLNQMKLMRAGMKVTLSSKGKTKHTASIEFPLPQSEQVSEGNGADNYNTQSSDQNNTTYGHQNHDTGYFRKNFIMNHLMMNAAGFASGNGIVPVKNSSGMNAAINWDDNSDLIYELAIPIKEFFGTGYTIQNATDEITLSVEVNALQHASMQEGNGGGGYHGGQYGEGMHHDSYGGGSHNGSYGGSHGGQWSEEDRSSLSVKTSFKQKFVLSKTSQ